MQLDLFINQKAYAALCPEFKAMVNIASMAAHVDMQAKYDAKILLRSSNWSAPVPGLGCSLPT